MKPAAAAMVATLLGSVGMSSAVAEGLELRLDPATSGRLAQMLRGRGHACPEIRSVYKVGAEGGATILRMYCGQPKGARIEEPSFRVRAMDSGALTWEPWK